MKKRSKIAIALFALFALVGCTKNFCTNADKANIMANFASEAVEVGEDGEVLKTREEKIIEELKENGVVIPSQKYFDYLEEQIYFFAVDDPAVNKFYFGDKQLLNYDIEELKTTKAKDDVHKEEVYFYQTSYYASIRFVGYTNKTSNLNETLWANFDKWVINAEKTVLSDKYEGYVEVGEKKFTLTQDDLPSNYFITSYKTKFNTQVASVTTCITPKKGIYGGTILEGKNWGKAFDFGLIEGLIEYPIAWMLDGFYNVFNLGAVGAILSILIVTIIVRLFLLLITFKSTMSQTRMQEMQPELRALQAKYPNSNTNDYEKQQMAQEQMALYKKYKVNPFSMIIVMIVQFPIFIAVWGAMSGSAVLRLDTLFANGGSQFALSLSALTSNAILSGNISAIILFVIMSITQILSVKLPMLLQKMDAKKAPKLGKNPAQDQSNKQMNMISNVMMVMIIVMGFTLPVAMALYWVISALISLAQSMIIRAITKKKRENKFSKYKTK